MYVIIHINRVLIPDKLCVSASKPPIAPQEITESSEEEEDRDVTPGPTARKGRPLA
jgi:hypothetical protein